MTRVQLRDSDKAAIRDLTEEAIANNADARGLADLRRRLAESSGVSPRSLGSISAYVRYSATQALDESGLVGRVTREQLVHAARLLRDSPRVLHDAELISTGWGVDTQHLLRATESYERHYQRRPGGASRSGGNQSLTDEQSGQAGGETAVPSQADQPPPSPLADEAAEGVTNTSGDARCLVQVADVEDSPDEDEGVRGDTANYDFPAKREWRAFWADYIRNRFTPNRLRDAKVICLPGRLVEPEVALYLAMGVRPENIYAVEGSRRVREEFEQNARRLGIRYFSRPLEKVLPGLAVEFDIVNYDFHGQFCRGHFRSARATPLAPDAVVIYNAMGKREDRDMQQRLRGTAEASIESHRQAVEVLTGPLQTGVEGRLLQLLYSNCGSDDSDPTLRHLRTETARQLIATWTGSGRTPFTRKVLEEAVYATWDGVSESDIAAHADEYLRESIGNEFSTARHWMPRSLGHYWNCLQNDFRGRILRGCEPIHLGLALWHSTFGIPYYRDRIWSYDYLSESNSGRAKSPFLTTAFHLMRPDAVVGRHEPALVWCAALLSQYNRRIRGPSSNPVEDPLCALLDRRGRPRAPGGEVEWSDRLQVLNGNRVAEEVSVGTLREAILAMTSAKREYGLWL